MGFSRQEYWSGVPLPSPKMYMILAQISGTKLLKPLEFLSDESWQRCLLLCWGDFRPHLRMGLTARRIKHVSVCVCVNMQVCVKISMHVGVCVWEFSAPVPRSWNNYQWSDLFTYAFLGMTPMYAINEASTKKKKKTVWSVFRWWTRGKFGRICSEKVQKLCKPKEKSHWNL